jgi:hypothetical protein
MMLRFLLIVSLVLASAPVRAAEPVAPRTPARPDDQRGRRSREQLRLAPFAPAPARRPARARPCAARSCHHPGQRRQQPGARLAVRGPEPEGTWLLEGTAVGDLLRHTTGFENSTLAGYSLRPATRAELRRTFVELKTRLRQATPCWSSSPTTAPPIRATRSTTASRSGERMSRSRCADLRGCSHACPPRCAWCRSCPSVFRAASPICTICARAPSSRPGQPAATFRPPPTVPPTAAIPRCAGPRRWGTPSSSCRPFPNGRFSGAHARVVLSDQSPDVPLRSSEVFLDEILLRAARAQRADENKFVDEILGKAWADKGFAAERDRAYRLADAVRSAAPARVHPGRDQPAGDELAAFLDGLEAHAKAWATALGDLNQARLDAFSGDAAGLGHAPGLAGLAQAGTGRAAQPGVELLRELRAPDRGRRQAVLLVCSASSTPRPASTRSPTGPRCGWPRLLRMRTLLLDVAGRFYLQSQGNQPRKWLPLPRWRVARISTSLAPVAGDASPAVKPALAALDTDRQAAARAQPAWLGFVFAPVALRLVASAWVFLTGRCAWCRWSRIRRRAAPGCGQATSCSGPLASRSPGKTRAAGRGAGVHRREWPLDLQRGSKDWCCGCGRSLRPKGTARVRCIRPRRRGRGRRRSRRRGGARGPGLAGCESRPRVSRFRMGIAPGTEPSLKRCGPRARTRCRVALLLSTRSPCSLPFQ